MNRPSHPNLAVLLLTISLAGCASRNEPIHRPVQVKHPPAGPASQPLALDPALAANARQQIFSSLASSDPVLRAHAVEAMKQALGAKASSQIISALSDKDPIVRFAATLAAGELRLADAKEPMYRLVQDPDASVRVGARFALHRLGDTRLSHDLELTSHDPVARTRGHTAMVL